MISRGHHVGFSSNETAIAQRCSAGHVRAKKGRAKTSCQNKIVLEKSRAEKVARKKSCQESEVVRKRNLKSRKGNLNGTDWAP